MKQKSAELVFIIDKSGSMGCLETDTIGGFNSLIEKRKKEGGDIKVTTVLFDTEFTTLHDSVPIESVEKMTDRDYCPSGGTALLDAVGSTINRVKEARLSMKKKDVPKSTLFVITTDGYENSSQEFNYESVKNLIEKQKEEGWEFIFMGANIDAAKEASRFGLSEKCAINYAYDKIGVSQCYETADAALDCIMCCKKLESTNIWREEIDDYFEETEGKKKKRSKESDADSTW